MFTAFWDGNGHFLVSFGKFDLLLDLVQGWFYALSRRSRDAF